jgi:hypothetical protein
LQVLKKFEQNRRNNSIRGTGKKLLSLLLAVAIVAAMLSVAVFAEGPEILIDLAGLQIGSNSNWSYNGSTLRLFSNSTENKIFHIRGEAGTIYDGKIRPENGSNGPFYGTIILENVSMRTHYAPLDFVNGSTAILELIGENKFVSDWHAGININSGNLTIKPHNETASGLTAIAGGSANGIGTGEDTWWGGDTFESKPIVTIIGNCTVTVQGTAQGNALGAKSLTMYDDATLVLNNTANPSKGMDSRTTKDLSDCTITGSSAGAYTYSTITLAAMPTGGGNPTANKIGGAYADEEIILETRPNFGYTFTNWEVISPGALTNFDATDPQTTFTMPAAAVEIHAHYTINRHNLMVTAGKGGSVTASATDSTAVGTSVTVTANARSGYAFHHWEATGISVNNTAAISFSMPDNNVTLRAVFQYVGGSSYHDNDSDESSTPEPVIYPVTTHFGIYEGNGSLSATIDADYSKFERLTRNGSVVEPTNYTVAQGSTVITLKDSYLRTLANGTHLFVAEYSDGYSQNIPLNVKVPDVPQPQTDKKSNMLGWSALLLGSVLGILLLCLVVWLIRRKNKGIR